MRGTTVSHTIRGAALVALAWFSIGIAAAQSQPATQPSIPQLRPTPPPRQATFSGISATQAGAPQAPASQPAAPAVTTGPAATRPAGTQPATSQSASGIAVWVNGEAITDREIDNRTAEVIGGSNLPEAQMAQLFPHYRPTVLKNAIELRLINAAIAKAGFQITDEQVRAAVEEEHKAYLSLYGLDPLEFARATRQTYQKSVEAYLAERVKDPQIRGNFTRQAFIATKFPEEIKPTDEEMQEDYNSHKADRFHRPPQVRASEIVIGPWKTDQDKEAARKLAATVVAEARKPGADFAALAAKYSTAADHGPGGDLGFFARDCKTISAAVTLAAFGLKVGEISDPVDDTDGVHIIKLTERREAGPWPFAEAAFGIRFKFRSFHINKQQSKYADELAVGNVVYPPGKEPRPGEGMLKVEPGKPVGRISQ